MSRCSNSAHGQQVAEVHAGTCLYLAGGTGVRENLELHGQRLEVQKSGEVSFRISRSLSKSDKNDLPEVI